MGIPNPVRTLSDAFDMPVFILPPALAADSLREASMFDILLLEKAEAGGGAGVCCSEEDVAEGVDSVVSWSDVSRRV